MNLQGLSIFKLSIASAALVFGIAPPAQAISLNLSSGSWHETVGGSGIVYQSVGNETQILWGIPFYGGTSQKSGMGFTGVGSSTFGLGEIFQVGQLRHFNNVILAGTQASAVNLSLNLNFDNPVETQSFNLNLKIEETPNQLGSCAYFSITPCADKISISETSLSNQFSIAGIDYTLHLLGFSLTPGGTPINQFISQEGGTNQALLFAKVTAAEPQTVPEPATVAGTALWLLGTRWAVVSKRKKAKR